MEKNSKNNTEPLLREPEHQTLESMEFDKTDITNEHELSTYPKDKERAELERIEAKVDDKLKKAGLFKQFERRNKK